MSVNPDAVSETEEILGLGNRGDRWATWALGTPLTLIVAGLCVLMLVTWIPHYLTWPWWVDLENFANCAQAWDSGILPYRDITAYSPPGQIYLFWALGKTFGWGRTAPIYALDAGLVILLGIALLGWSRRVFGWYLPGLIGYASFLWYYLSLDLPLVAQRDWHASFFAVLALLGLEAFPGRGGRLASALLLGLAFAFRPHVVFFLPAILLAIDERARPTGGPWSSTVRVVLGWGAAFAAALLLAFSPLIRFGILDDFLGNFVRFAFVNRVGGPPSNPVVRIAAFVMQFFEFKVTAPWLMLILGLSSQNLRPMQRLMLTWVVAFGGILFYRTVHPQDLNYLGHPLKLVGAVCLAILVHMVLKAWPLVPSMKKLGVALALLGLAVPSWPFYAHPKACYDLMRSAARGRAWAVCPLGYGLRSGTLYPWEDYSALLAYFRKATRPDSRIANLITSGVAVHGAVGRLSVFMTEGGIHWAWSASGIERGWEQTLARQLEQTPNSVVVWNPIRLRNRLGAFEPVVLQYYEPEARFGEIEVWRRKS